MQFDAKGRTAMKLYRVIVPVRDIEAAVRFYSSVLGEPGRRVSGGRHYFGDAAHGGAILACYSPRDDGDAARYGDAWQPHPLQYVYISTDNVEAARARCVAAGAKDVTSIGKMPWGETMFYALDPFGNPISFVESGTEFTGA
jgi:catechol 2,3-dioxygenase-like lactoylglutathione lyase family enzyme